jgi:plastocyanin
VNTYRKKLALSAMAILFAISAIFAQEGHQSPKNAAAQDEILRPSSQEQNITVRLFHFQPTRLQVALGTTVTWTNEDEIYHSITAENAVFNQALDRKGKKFSFTFNKPGTYTYYCERHEHMRGAIEVG